MDTTTDLTTRYETRTRSKAITIGKILVDSGFEVKVFTAQYAVEDLVTGETDTAEFSSKINILRTNAPYDVLNAARTTYRDELALIVGSSIENKLTAE